MADHVGWKLSCDLFQNIRQCNIIKMMDPGGWIFAGACLNGNRSLYILPLKIKMSQPVSYTHLVRYGERE